MTLVIYQLVVMNFFKKASTPTTESSGDETASPSLPKESLAAKLRRQSTEQLERAKAQMAGAKKDGTPQAADDEAKSGGDGAVEADSGGISTSLSERLRAKASSARQSLTATAGSAQQSLSARAAQLRKPRAGGGVGGDGDASNDVDDSSDDEAVGGAGARRSSAERGAELRRSLTAVGAKVAGATSKGAAAAAAATRRARHGAARRYGARDGDCAGSPWREVRRSCL